jgi:hypothetical protein
MIPDAVEREIRKLASERRISLSKASILLLERALGIDSRLQKARDLRDLFGSWSREEHEEFLKNTNQFHKIDSDIWK